jgi:Mor family transcriptional regulator
MKTEHIENQLRLLKRNKTICREYACGYRASALAVKYDISRARVYAILKRYSNESR